MRKILLVLAVASIYLSGCQKKCDLGYEGKGCKTETRSKFYGTYNGTLTYNTTSTTTYFQVGTMSSDATALLVGKLSAKISDSKGNFNIPTQELNDFNGTQIGTVSGNGIFEGNKLTLTFTTYTNGTTLYYFTGIK
jgi:hypothetical protein